MHAIVVNVKTAGRQDVLLTVPRRFAFEMLASAYSARMYVDPRFVVFQYGGRRHTVTSRSMRPRGA